MVIDKNKDMENDRIEELREKLCNDIRWFKTGGDCLNYLENHDWEGEFIFHNGKGFWDTFYAKCRKLLANEMGGQEA